MANPSKSSAYVDAVVREAVVRVLHSLYRPLQEAGYAGPASTLALSDVQQDFLAGYVYGSLQRLLEMGEIGSEEEVALATRRLYGGLFGASDNVVGPWHEWVVREGLHHLRRPHVFLGYCTGRNDIVAQLRFGRTRNALADALRHLGSEGNPPFGCG